MKLKLLSIISVFVVLIAACSSSKKTSTTAGNSSGKKPKNGVYAPGDNEVAAIQKQFPDASMGKLQEGYSIYTGSCTGCHKAKNIYRFSTEEWKKIMDKMAPKAKLNGLQKDAVYQYVLAIKATQQTK
ncbi:MAG: hypothetical protein V4561_08875 [Bacteroidota bacterium]